LIGGRVERRSAEGVIRGRVVALLLPAATAEEEPAGAARATGPAGAATPFAAAASAGAAAPAFQTTAPTKSAGPAASALLAAERRAKLAG
jgi:hypothetical protein